MKNNPGFDLAAVNFLNATSNQQDLTMQPLKLDFNDLQMMAPEFHDYQPLEANFDDIHLQPAANDQENHPHLMQGSHDYPSLRDLETSNMFSRINHNFNIQRHLDEKRIKKLDDLKGKFAASKSGDSISFDDILNPPLYQSQKQKNSQKSVVPVKKISKAEAVELFMDLLVFT